jgi:hypothetical protein
MNGLQEYAISDIRVTVPQVEVVRVRLYRIKGHGIFCATGEYMLEQPFDWCSDVVEIEVDA